QTRNQLVPVDSVSPEERQQDRGPFADLYHHLLTSSWPLLLAQISAGFFAINALFAVAYYLDGGIANARPGSFADVFFFSIESMATRGSGRMAPVILLALFLMSFEALTGMIGLAVTSGLIFEKFWRTSGRGRFTRCGVISWRGGGLSLMFRLANERASQSVEA